jgi:hypothetical protein
MDILVRLKLDFERSCWLVTRSSHALLFGFVDDILPVVSDLAGRRNLGRIIFQFGAYKYDILNELLECHAVAGDGLGKFFPEHSLSSTALNVAFARVDQFML